ncbi:hypothetical protein ACWIWK_01755 [Helicobacter sp. 23-1048]
MNRAEKFDTEVKQRLNDLKKDIENFDRTILDENQMQEFARAEKVLKYLLAQINLIDADLLPQSFYNEVANISTWDTQNITALNDILDSSLMILNKYRNLDIAKGRALQNINDILKAYSSSINQSIKALKLDKVKQDSNSIQTYEKDLNSENGIRKQIENTKNEIQLCFNEIKKFSDNFFVKQEGKDISVKAELEHIQNDINATYKSLNDITINFTQKLTELDEFYIKIFGAMENGQRVGGLQQEIKDRQNQLDEYDKKQKEAIQVWKDEIENLLKNATNASLASSYEKSKESYTKAIYGWNATFIVSMLSIVGIAFWSFFAVADKINEPLVILGAILVRLPFYIPLAWLAIFSTQRRNESKRLQEEYKHKETLARSFLGYKKQIDEMQDSATQDNINLAKKLMENLVEITSQNPNDTLKKHKNENVFMIEILEKLAKAPSEVKNFLKEVLNVK